MQVLQKELYTGRFSILIDERISPLSVASMLKRVLREMPEPLCTTALYPDFRDLAFLATKDRIQPLKHIFMKMKSVFRNTFFCVLEILYHVAKQGTHNLMDARSLSIVLAPNLFRPEKEGTQDLLEYKELTSVLALAI